MLIQGDLCMIQGHKPIKSWRDFQVFRRTSCWKQGQKWTPTRLHGPLASLVLKTCKDSHLWWSERNKPFQCTTGVLASIFLCDIPPIHSDTEAFDYSTEGDSISPSLFWLLRLKTAVLKPPDIALMTEWNSGAMCAGDGILSGFSSASPWPQGLKYAPKLRNSYLEPSLIIISILRRQTEFSAAYQIFKQPMSLKGSSLRSKTGPQVQAGRDLHKSLSQPQA